MKNLILTLVVLGLSQVTFLHPSLAAYKSVAHKPTAKRADYPVHIMPDQNISYEQITMMGLDETISDYVNEAIRVGKKNMDWLKHMNALLSDGQKIALTKPGELTPIPIDKPKVYSPETVERDFKELLSTVPENMKNIIFGTADFTDTPGIDLETYIHWAKKVDKMYQTAARWLTLKPYMSYYQQNKVSDIRGYYFLSKEENLKDKLTNFSSLSTDDQTRLTPLLINMCENKDGLTGCENKFKKALQTNTVLAFYEKYLSKSKATFDENFVLGGIRTDIKWTSADPSKAYIPIRPTENAEVNQFLEYNIEDEWKWDGWNLDLEFKSNAAVHVEFVPGDTPHVDGLGGNKITMDGNAPLTEWDVQWTIRHEFGHVLGFPDCYVEFYDNNLKAMVNYQIDTANMMCSRAGKMQEVHYTEMKKNYFH